MEVSPPVLTRHAETMPASPTSRIRMATAGYYRSGATAIRDLDDISAAGIQFVDRGHFGFEDPCMKRSVQQSRTSPRPVFWTVSSCLVLRTSRKLSALRPALIAKYGVLFANSPCLSFGLCSTHRDYQRVIGAEAGLCGLKCGRTKANTTLDGNSVSDNQISAREPLRCGSFLLFTSYRDRARVPLYSQQEKM